MLKSLHLKKSELLPLSDFNLVIGYNDSGKSRFLKLVEKAASSRDVRVMRIPRCISKRESDTCLQNKIVRELAKEMFPTVDFHKKEYSPAIRRAVYILFWCFSDVCAEVLLIDELGIGLDHHSAKHLTRRVMSGRKTTQQVFATTTSISVMETECLRWENVILARKKDGFCTYIPFLSAPGVTDFSPYVDIATRFTQGGPW